MLNLNQPVIKSTAVEPVWKVGIMFCFSLPSDLIDCNISTFVEFVPSFCIKLSYSPNLFLHEFDVGLQVLYIDISSELCYCNIQVLIYDRYGQDIISPLLTVKELRDLGVTLHL